MEKFFVHMSENVGQANFQQIYSKGYMLGRLTSIFSCIRYRETLIFQTPTLIGLAFFIPGVSISSTINALAAALGSFLVMASIFAINDWADITLDSQNPLKRKDTFLEFGINPIQMLGLAISLAAGGIIVFATLSKFHVLTALGAIVFGLVYSVPIHGMRGKSMPVFSSFLHFGGTLLSFLLGALTFAPADWQNLLVAFHPAILITAGHLIHEVEDYEQDLIAKCQTNAVRFGREAVFIFASLLFGFSFLLLFWLTEEGYFPGVIKYTLFFYLLYAVLALQAYRAGLTRDNVRHLQNQYRILFAVVVLAMLIVSLLKM